MNIDGGSLRQIIKRITRSKKLKKEKRKKHTKKKTKKKRKSKKRGKRENGNVKARILLVNPRSTKVARKLRNERENVFTFDSSKRLCLYLDP